MKKRKERSLLNSPPFLSKSVQLDFAIFLARLTWPYALGRLAFGQSPVFNPFQVK